MNYGILETCRISKTKPYLVFCRDLPVNQRQKSLEVIDPSSFNQMKTVRLTQAGNFGYQRLKERSMSMPTR